MADGRWRMADGGGRMAVGGVVGATSSRDLRRMPGEQGTAVEADGFELFFLAVGRFLFYHGGGTEGEEREKGKK